MEVTLHLILGIILTLAKCSCAKEPNLQDIGGASIAFSPPLSQNVTEINNRDLNKIIRDHPKTETLDAKATSVNSVNNYEQLPLKLSKNGIVEKTLKINETEDEKNTGEVDKKDKEKRVESSRSIDTDDSKYWSADHKFKKNIFTPAPDLEKFHEQEFHHEADTTKYHDFELTTPLIHGFDNKFKETVDGLDQKIDDNIRLDEENHYDSDEELYDTQEDDKFHDSHIFVTKPHNNTVNFTDTKSVLNNETGNKTYDEHTTKETTPQTISTQKNWPTSTTNKNTLIKPQFEKTQQILSNKIETETIKAIINTTDTKTNKVDTLITTTTSFTTSVPSTQPLSIEKPKNNSVVTENPFNLDFDLRANVSEQENQVIPLTEQSELPKISKKIDDVTKTEESTTENIQLSTTTHNIETTESQKDYTESFVVNDLNTTTETPYSTTEVVGTTIIPDGTTINSKTLNETTTDFYQFTTPMVEEGTTTFVIETTSLNTERTTEGFTSTIETSTGKINDEIGRTSKSLYTGIVTENTSEKLADMVSVTTEAEETTTENIESSTSSVGKKTSKSLYTGLVSENVETDDTTTENVESSTKYSGQRTSKSLYTSIVTEKISKTSEKSVETTTENVTNNYVDSTTLNNAQVQENIETEINTIEKEDPSETKVVDLESTTPVVTLSDSTSLSTGTEDTTPKLTTLKNIVVPSKTPGSEETTSNDIVLTTVTKSSEIIEETTLTYNKQTTQVNTNFEKPSTVPTGTTEFTFVHIENVDNDHTTLHPEILSPSLNYSIPFDKNEQMGGRITATNETSDPVMDPTIISTSSTTVSNAETPLLTNITSTSEETTNTTPNEGNFKDEGMNKGKIAAIAISSVGAVCLILLAGLLYVMKKRQKRLNYGPRCRPVSLDDYSIDNLSVYNSVRRKGNQRVSKRSFGNPAFDDPVAPSHPLNFPALANFATNTEDIRAEFEEIPQISASTSELPDGCDSKNRYANVIPLPETRVYLKPIEGHPNSDYINANYVTGPKGIKGYYIATQGPMENTVDDFWKMVWEQEAKVILMMTLLVENGLGKCADYLPESEISNCSKMFGDFQITMKKREVKEKYIISSIQLKNMVSNSWREVTHFWYMGWPEKGVPTEANSLIAFLIEARSFMKTATLDKKTGEGANGFSFANGSRPEHNPVVVHCSPGTGRTGVVIACDIAIREFETTRLVDIPKIVYRIRRDRANAVQTKEQYQFIYKVVSVYATKLTGGALDNHDV